MSHKLRRVLLLAGSIGIGVLSNTICHSQTPDQAKLGIANINLISASPGPYVAQVGLVLQRPNSPQFNFVVIIREVHNVDEVYDKLRPAVNNLAEDLKNASISIPSTH
jgi:hypothetical protein